MWLVDVYNYDKEKWSHHTVKSDNLLSCQGKESHILILKPRYEKEAFDLESDDEIVVGGALYLKDEYEGEDEKYLMSICKYVLIGRLKK